MLDQNQQPKKTTQYHPLEVLVALSRLAITIEEFIVAHVKAKDTFLLRFLVAIYRLAITIEKFIVAPVKAQDTFLLGFAKSTTQKDNSISSS